MAKNDCIQELVCNMIPFCVPGVSLQVTASRKLALHVHSIKNIKHRAYPIVSRVQQTSEILLKLCNFYAQIESGDLGTGEYRKGGIW